MGFFLTILVALFITASAVMIASISYIRGLKEHYPEVYEAVSKPSVFVFFWNKIYFLVPLATFLMFGGYRRHFRKEDAFYSRSLLLQYSLIAETVCYLMFFVALFAT